MSVHQRLLLGAFIVVVYGIPMVIVGTVPNTGRKESKNNLVKLKLDYTKRYNEPEWIGSKYYRKYYRTLDRGLLDSRYGFIFETKDLTKQTPDCNGLAELEQELDRRTEIKLKRMLPDEVLMRNKININLNTTWMTASMERILEIQAKQLEEAANSAYKVPKTSGGKPGIDKLIQVPGGR